MVFFSLRTKLLALVLLISLTTIGLGIFQILSLRSLDSSFREIIDGEIPRIKATEQSLLTLSRATSGLSASVLVDDLESLQNLRDQEREFDKAIEEFELLNKALVFGSESDAFKTIEGGNVSREWVRLGFDKQFDLVAPRQEESQVAQEAFIFFSAYTKYAKSVFQAKRELVSSPEGAGVEDLEHELSESLDRILELQAETTTLMRRFISLSDKGTEVLVAAHTDEVEATQRVTLIVIGLSFVLAISSGTFFSNKLVLSRIFKLEKGTEYISKGNFDTTVSEGSDEIGQLGASINDMAKDLKKYYSGLQEAVNVKTKALRITKTELEKQQKALLNLLEDLNEEKKVKETQSKSLLENIGEGIIMTNDSGAITYVNPAFEVLTGFSLQELKGKTVADSLTAFNRNDKRVPPKDLADAAMVTARDQETKLSFLRKNKTKVSVVINASPLYVEDKFRGVIRVIHDISEEINLAQKKDDFFSIASHELRTPLTVISGNLDIVLQGYGKSQLTKDDKDLITDTVEASDRLIKMVNDFLNVSRIDQDRLKYELVKIDANSIITSTVEQVRKLASDKNIYLKLEKPRSGLLVNADEGLLREIIINLISNAVKFTKEGGITVTEKINGTNLEVRVTDTGAGIKKELQKQLFQRFQQVTANKTLAREAGGTGLGLYISREFAKVMKGDLILEESTLGKGSTFLLSLPLAKA